MSPQARAWLILLAAGILETGWAIGLKHSRGFTRAGPSALTILAMVASMYLLARAVQVLPIGTAYAVWTGIGAIGTALLGMLLFNEPRTAIRLVSMVLIVAGIVGLRLGTR